MRELRLIDPYGYTVPGTVHTNYPAHAEPDLRQQLREIAERDAAEWGHHTADYRIEPAAPQGAVQRLAQAA
ncbi:hypothetical protein Srufu_080350 (plasmid) [Streptomyces libani subsp. rufus]|nr:hypothetical protein Srufu_080350 [Streptomyces libani subsp. rufus]